MQAPWVVSVIRWCCCVRCRSKARAAGAAIEVAAVGRRRVAWRGAAVARRQSPADSGPIDAPRRVSERAVLYEWRRSAHGAHVWASSACDATHWRRWVRSRYAARAGGRCRRLGGRRRVTRTCWRHGDEGPPASLPGRNEAPSAPLRWCRSLAAASTRCGRPLRWHLSPCDASLASGTRTATGVTACGAGAPLRRAQLPLGWLPATPDAPISPPSATADRRCRCAGVGALDDTECARPPRRLPSTRSARCARGPWAAEWPPASPPSMQVPCSGEHVLE